MGVTGAPETVLLWSAPEGFGVAGSLEERIGGTWGRVVARFAADGEPLVRTAPSVELADIETVWAVCLGSVRELFAAHYGAANVEERFRVPDDYAAFMQIVGGG